MNSASWPTFSRTLDITQYFAFLNADDEYLPGHLHKGLKVREVSAGTQSGKI